MNCGVCTGVCPAAEFYNYDPRQIVNIVQTQDDDAIEELMRSDVIWYCGECMSCRPRCPRRQYSRLCHPGAADAFPKARFLRREREGAAATGPQAHDRENILRTGYCVTPKLVKPELHPRAGYGLGVDLRER